MTLPGLTIRRYLLVGVLLLAVAGLAAPYLHVDRFGDRIRLALEESLHRKVVVGSVGLDLFRGPGFTLQNVVIYDDPAAGNEPFAYVGSIEARLRLTSLFGGRLEFAALRLEDASVNLVKTAQGPWNFQTLLAPSAALRLPSVSVRDGRLNFKFGGVKSVFYVSSANLNASPPSAPGGAITFEFSGEPTRTDRTAHSFGAFSGRGRWRPLAGSGGEMDLEFSLEKSSIGELIRMIHGQDIGVHGQVGGQARLRGPLTDLAISGTLQLSEIHRWDLLPPYAEGGPLSFRGHLDLLSQNLDIETAPSTRSALVVRFQASNYLAHPRWTLGLNLNELPVAGLMDVVRHMGAGLAESASVRGAATGAVSYSSENGFQGSVLLKGASISMPNAPAVSFQDAELVLDGEHLKLSPVVIGVGDREKALLEFDYSFTKQLYDLKLTAQAMSIAALQEEGGPLPGLPRPAFVSELRGGVWRGWLRYQRAGELPAEWSGALGLKGSQVLLPGLAQPLVLQAAEVTLKGDTVSVRRIQATAGAAEIQGGYSYRPGAPRPHRIEWHVAKLQASDLEHLLAPTIQRPRSFLSRALRFPRAPVPDWLAARHAEGTLEIGTLVIAGQTFESVQMAFFWDGASLEVTRLKARVEGGSVEGHLEADFSGPVPVIQAGGRLQQVAWRGGRLEGDVSLKASGSGEDLLGTLQAEGFFQAQSVSLGPDLPIHALSGSWALRWLRKQPRLELTDLRLADGQDVLTGEGVTSDDGRLQIDLTRGDRHLRLAGSLQPIRLEISESR